MAKTQMNTQDLDTILEKAVEQRASDLHLVSEAQPIVRINGSLVPLDDTHVLTSRQLHGMIEKLLTAEQLQTFETERELDLAYQIEELARFRINVHWEKQQPSLVARVVPMTVPTMDQLALPKPLYDFIERTQGLLLITGPTGSGKSTTLAAMVDHLNRNTDLHIVTLEDPMEFEHTSDTALIRQRELGTDFLSFPEALKHVLRQDPDVILVGEMRDLETISAAMTVAETGHLVLSTLHTNGAEQTVDRIVDVFPPHQQQQIRTQLAAELIGVVSQQLLPTVDGGRVAAREILVNTPAIAHMIRDGKTEQMQTTIQTSGEQGMITMERSAQWLLDKGYISETTAQRFLAHHSTAEPAKKKRRKHFTTEK
jgi:twitching motility protein PilT